jgi:DNA-binding transcriptional ArsR family regulator
LDIVQPAVSQHLKRMHERDILAYSREGTRHYYSLANKFIIKILNCMSEVQKKLNSGEWDFDFSSTSNQEEVA